MKQMHQSTVAVTPQPGARAPAGAATGPARSAAVEVLPGKLYVIGGNMPIDGRASWVPPGETGYQPANMYLLRGEHDVLVDTGIAAVGDEVLSGLASILEPDAPVRMFLTRPQLDCTGNIIPVAERYRVIDIFTGGAANPFDQFDARLDAANAADPKGRVRGLEVGRSIEGPPVETFGAPIRILTTFWGYDPTTRTLFTSDSFTHATVEDAGGRPVIDTAESDTITVDQVADYLLAAFWWLSVANTTAIVANLRAFFATHPVEVIAPARGCVLSGASIVQRHIDMVLEALESLSLRDARKTSNHDRPRSAQ